jgi:Uma2 family endonuclease
VATAEIALPKTPLEAEPEGPYEIIDGRMVEKSLGVRKAWVAFKLFCALDRFVESSGHGNVVFETLFRLEPDRDRERRPDVAFLSGLRWTVDRPPPRVSSLRAIPEIAVEVVGPTDLANEVQGKVEEYLRAGVRQVWVVYTAHGSIVSHKSLKLAKTHHRGDVLDGGSLLPGFALFVSDVLPEPEEGQGEPPPAGTA